MHKETIICCPTNGSLLVRRIHLLELLEPEVPVKLSYCALGNIDNPQFIQFTTTPLTNETEITGHIVAHLNVSMSALVKLPTPRDIDLFLTLRHISPQGKEVFYTGTARDPVTLCKGWQRVSLRKVNTDHSKNRPCLPHRDYFSTDVLPVIPGDVYSVDVEIWPTNVVIEEGGKLLLEVASDDTQGCGPYSTGVRLIGQRKSFRSGITFTLATSRRVTLHFQSCPENSCSESYLASRTRCR